MQDKYTPNWKKQKIFIRIVIAVILAFGVAIYITKMDSKSTQAPELTAPPPAQQFETPVVQPETPAASDESQSAEPSTDNPAEPQPEQTQPSEN